MSKRSLSQEKDQGGESRSSDAVSPGTKRPRLVSFEPIRLPAISTVTELDMHALVFQNRKLAERLEQRKRVEFELRNRIEKLEQRQIRDDVFLCIINRHWNRLDEDVRILLQRFDAETEVEGEADHIGESESTTSFLTLLSQWDREELDRELTQRVEFSKRDIAKLIKTFDRLSRRNEKITTLLNQKIDDKNSGSGSGDSDSGKQENGSKTAEKNSPNDGNNGNSGNINSELLANNIDLREENRRLQKLASTLQEKNYALSSDYCRMKDRLSAAETKLDETRKELEEADFQLGKANSYSDKLEFQLTDLHKKLQQIELQVTPSGGDSSAKGGAGTSQNGGSAGSNDNSKENMTSIERSKITELTANLDEHRELAASRLTELQELTDKHVKALQLVEQLRSELTHVPESVILNSVQYCRLQSQFSILYNESCQIRTQLEEIRGQLISTKMAHLKQIEQMEGEELLAQKQLRAEMVQLEDQLSQVRREYEMLRVEFEQNLAASEQSGPLNKEMRQLLTSYKVQNGQFRNEVQRFKRKWKEAVSTIAKVQKELDLERKAHDNCAHIPLNTADDEKIVVDLESSEFDIDDDSDSIDELKNLSVKELKSRLRCAERKCAEFQLSLNASSSKQSADDTANPDTKKLKIENFRLKTYIANIVKKKGKEVLYSAEESYRHSKKNEEQIDKLKKEVAACKQEEETLLNEMEVTGQAFEEMQEQNVRLVQQLKEKDDANFKLMSDRIRTNQQQKLLREEKDLLQDQVTALQNQVEAQNLVVRKLEEKESLLQQQLATIEKELTSRQQALDLHRRKAVEGAQSLADLKLQVEKLSAQLNEAQQAIAAKTASLEEESFRIVRLQEEISVQRKRLERSKKLEKADAGTDEILLEEIRELKEQLTCPSCKVRRKDGVLTKCYHVFCMDCLKTRYETRQRKCPKCNAAFGANDFKRIYIA